MIRPKLLIVKHVWVARLPRHLSGGADRWVGGVLAFVYK